MWKDSCPQLCVCVCVYACVSVCVCVKADSLLLSCSSGSCRRTLRAQFPQFFPLKYPGGEGLCILGKVALLWRAEDESFDWGIQSSGPGLVHFGSSIETSLR